MSGLDIQVTGAVLPAAETPIPFDWIVEAGTCHGLVGESGSGKTTLVRVILGQVAPRRGAVRVGPFSLPWRDRRERIAFARAVAFIPQDAVASLDPTWPAWRLVTEPLVIHGVVRGREALRQRAVALLREVGLGEEHLDRRPHQLSGGQCQRLCIARALASSPCLVLADEPVSALDPVLQTEVLSLLAWIRERTGATLVLVSHTLGLVQAAADHVTVMAGGRAVETGPVAQVLSAPRHPATRSLVRAEVGSGPRWTASERPRDGFDLRGPRGNGYP